MAPPPGIVEVRCAGCEETLEVEHGLTEFACPDCGTAQALPPELMPRRPRRALPLPGRVTPVAATPSRVSCGGCGAVLSVPHGHGHFSCPLCGTELAASPAAAVLVIAPPAAVPITLTRPAHPSEVLAGPSSQSVHSRQLRKPIRSELKSSFREESFSSFGADTRTEIPVIGRLQNGPADPSSHREDLDTENMFAADQAQLDFATKATGNKKKSSKNSKANKKRKTKSVMKSSNELPHLRRSKRLVKGSPDLVEPEPNQKVDVSTNQSQSGAPCIERTLVDPDPRSPVHQFPHGGFNELDDVDTTTPTPSTHDAPQAHQLRRNIQMYSPKTRSALPVRSSNSWHEREMPPEIFSGIDQLNRDNEEVLSDQSESETQSQDMDWQLTQEACNDKNHSGHLRLKPQNENLSDGRQKKNSFTCSSLNDGEHPEVRTFSETRHKTSLSASCSHLAASLPFSAATTLSTTMLPSSREYTRSTILTEFLKRYKWSPGQEEECQKILDRKAVRQLFNLFCYEKQRARQQLAAKKAKMSLMVHKACGMELEGDREDSEAHQGDELVVVPENEDPKKWKPFVPRWMKPKWWEMLCDHWATDEVMKDMDNVEKLGCDIDSPTKTPVGKGVAVDQNACETEEAEGALVGSHALQEQVGSLKRERHCGAIGVCNKVQNESLSKSSPGCGCKVSSGVAKMKHCQLSREDTLDSADGKSSPSARDDGDNQDEEEHSG
ncbi:hypothetical protein PR202_gb14432 [Eleusine coracana subsp. coracana]|uniref:Uncharacterized protein n=1 Tax=Eleusine coracana subsp. coracana TaxID=191504 RepID=A0AAV5EWA8_ELECO|nr:hypothetical protein PR202_gb14432 [Eleusine coracana subsp. coracana]